MLIENTVINEFSTSLLFLPVNQNKIKILETILDMAAVLFIVTIPIEAEELRLQNEYISRKLQLNAEYDTRKNPIYFCTTPAATNTTPIAKAKTENYVENDEAESGPSTPLTAISVPNVNDHKLYEDFLQPRKYETNSDELLIDGALSEGAGANSAIESRTTATAKGSLAKANDSEKHSMGTDSEAVDAPPIIRKSWEGVRDMLSSSKRKSNKKKQIDFDLDMPSNTCMEIVLREILKKYKILNAVWTKDSKGCMYQIIFIVDFDKTYETVLEKFNEWGIGDRDGSTVAVMNCIVSKTFGSKNDFDINGDISKENINDAKQGIWERFMNTVQSRLNVSQIVRGVRQDASITFDFIILLISAAILASFGLAEDSTIFLASSMLISPLMGPIIAGIFGTVIRDHSLRTLGLKNELFGILIATFVGFLFGMVVCTIDARYSIEEGLTMEMVSRCEIHSLLVGICTAIPSGAAAAISILGGNIGSLVGVAISASLLPPAVNSGLLWALACVCKFFENDDTRYKHVIKSQLYSKNQATELAIMGTISMCLTITNILCIYIMGVLVLKVKEIAPVISRNNRQFWKHDIKIARDLNKNRIDTDTTIIDEFVNLPKEDQKVLGIDCDFLRNIQMDEHATYQNTWSPNGRRHHFEQIYETIPENYSTIHHIERIYSTITRQQALNQNRYRFGISRRPVGRKSDVCSSYKVLTEKLPRFSTIPPNSIRPSLNEFSTGSTSESFEPTTSNITLVSNTSISTSEEKRRRKFTVTPAFDPLLLNGPVSPDEVDV